jgi:hypothetical protein
MNCKILTKDKFVYMKVQSLRPPWAEKKNAKGCHLNNAIKYRTQFYEMVLKGLNKH